MSAQSAQQLNKLCATGRAFTIGSSDKMPPRFVIHRQRKCSRQLQNAALVHLLEQLHILSRVHMNADKQGIWNVDCLSRLRSSWCPIPLYADADCMACGHRRVMAMHVRLQSAAILCCAFSAASVKMCRG